MKIPLPNCSITDQTLCALATALLLISSPVAHAQPNPDNPARPRTPIGERSRADLPQRSLQAVAGSMERVLTQEQRESMRDILASQREATRGLLERMRVARQELLKASLAESFDEEAVRAKALAVAKLEADLTVLRAKALSQVQPPLSDHQIEQIMNPPPMDLRPPGNGEPRPDDRRGSRPPKLDPQ